MNILVPLNDTKHLKDYIKSGASEFYIGFYDTVWDQKFGDYVDINRLTGFREKANKYSFEEMLEVIAQVKSLGQHIFVTFNASIYSNLQLVWIKNYMERLSSTEVDGVIVSTVELATMAKDVGLFCVISTIAGVYNSDLVAFYKEAGANRIILPRDLSLLEIESIVTKEPDMEYEVFIMRNGCSFSDSNCLGLHRKEMCSVCASVKNAESIYYTRDNSFRHCHDIELNNKIYRTEFHDYSCGLCSVYRFLQLKIAACKIVGRCDEWEFVCKDIDRIKRNIEIAKKCKNEQEYLDHMVFPEERGEACKLGISCYYPELRF